MEIRVLNFPCEKSQWFSLWKSWFSLWKSEISSVYNLQEFLYENRHPILKKDILSCKKKTSDLGKRLPILKKTDIRSGKKKKSDPGPGKYLEKIEILSWTNLKDTENKSEGDLWRGPTHQSHVLEHTDTYGQDQDCSVDYQGGRGARGKRRFQNDIFSTNWFFFLMFFHRDELVCLLLVPIPARASAHARHVWCLWCRGFQLASI